MNDKISVSAFDLINTQDTLNTLVTAFDDITTLIGMVIHDNLPKHKEQAILRVLQSHAYEYMTLCETEKQEMIKYSEGVQ